MVFLNQVVFGSKARPVKISVETDVSTDASNCSQLIVMVRYVKEKSVVEDFLFCASLETSMTVIEVFKLVKNFFSENDIDLQIIGSVCIYVEPSVLGNRSGFAALVKREIPTL